MNVPSRRPGVTSPLARVLGLALLAGALTQLILSAAAVRLGEGKPIEREIRAGETHVYEVLLPPGRVVSGVVEQRGVDLVVRVIDPTGATIATVDSPNGTAGPEPWTLEGKSPGAWRIEVSQLVPGASAGHYEASITENIPADEHAERVAKARYQSPRMLQLSRERRAEGAAAIARFAKEMEGHAPLVEPVAGDPQGDVLLTFLMRAGPETRSVGLGGGPLASGEPSPLSRFEDTDLLYLTARAPRDARFTYHFTMGDPPPAGATRKQMEALRPPPAPDPWNPRQLFGSSFLELPGAPAQPWLQRTAGVPEGRVVESTIHSEILGEERKVGVYLPHGFNPAAGPYPYVVVFDGEAYGLDAGALVPTPAILDNLIAREKVPPMLAVLVESGATRNRDLPMSAPFGDFLAKELAPWLRREYRASEDPARATLAGSSFGGLCAAYCAFHHPEVFGNVLSQSGSFWFSPGALEIEAPHQLEAGALMREIVRAPSQRLRFWMEVGIFEGGNGQLAGSNQVAQNRHLRDVLQAKGYGVSYHEYSGGHDYASWRGSLADGLIELAGKPAAAKP